MSDTETESRYLAVLTEPIRVCASYLPKMGQGADAGLSLVEFQTLYRADPFYSWYGLDNPLMYAAHKAAGGMTSVYRQIGIGVERLFRQILQDQLGLTREQATWSYSVRGSRGKKARTLHLDGRIELAAVLDTEKRARCRQWLFDAAEDLDVAPRVRDALSGVVFEIRQGYKSKDSKRQNADLANASTAYTHAYLPCVVVLSTQIDGDIVTRYRNANWAMLTGSVSDKSAIRSTYVFMRDVVGFDLAAFFARHSETLREEVRRVLESLLTAEGGRT